MRAVGGLDHSVIEGAKPMEAFKRLVENPIGMLA